MENDEFELIAKDGIALNACLWTCPEPKATLCIVHGLGEHSGRYEHVASFLNENNFSVFLFDLRGHGKSSGKRGHTPSHETLLDDVEELLKSARAEHNDLPIFLFGHSFGGNIVSNYILKRNTNELTGAVISSAWFKAQIEPSTLLLKVMTMVNKLFPSFTQSNRLSSDLLTKDGECNQAYDSDPLVHQQLSVRLGLESRNAGIWAIDNASRLKIPALVWHGSEDGITSLSASKQFVENAGNLASFKLWEGVKHEPHNDLEKEEVLNFLLNWLLQKID